MRVIKTNHNRVRCQRFNEFEENLSQKFLKVSRNDVKIVEWARYDVKENYRKYIAKNYIKTTLIFDKIFNLS